MIAAADRVEVDRLSRKVRHLNRFLDEDVAADFGDARLSGVAQPKDRERCSSETHCLLVCRHVIHRPRRKRKYNQL